ncbi:hypothetical protein L1987_11939 [Smallanthus sonchifolius]|uniref:Uncharacterized protein n=1 Tax=Smallanthus sonchifolius TaxID=185202 RepID=A0ACB9JD96_9ASTR|nr:hypothetical protein L1987_11939 [Smallanthus sonchifolius]
MSQKKPLPQKTLITRDGGIRRVDVGEDINSREDDSDQHNTVHRQEQWLRVRHFFERVIPTHLFVGVLYQIIRAVEDTVLLKN